MREYDAINYAEIGGRIRVRRCELQLTQEQLAEQVGASSSFIEHIECAEIIPSVDTLMKLSHVLDTTLDYLVLGIHWRCEPNTCPLFQDMVNLVKAFGYEKKT